MAVLCSLRCVFQFLFHCLHQFSAHAPGDDGQCSVCGFALDPTQAVHTHAGEGDWRTDETSHWKQCQCGEEVGKEAHAWDKDGGICTVCGWESPEEPTEPVETNSGLGVILFVLAGLLVLAAAACVALILVLRKKPGKYGK